MRTCPCIHDARPLLTFKSALRNTRKNGPRPRTKSFSRINALSPPSEYALKILISVQGGWHWDAVSTRLRAASPTPL